MSDIINSLKQQPDDNLNPFKIKVNIRGADVKNSNIINMVIRESIFDILPVLELTFNDYGLFTDVFPLGDKDDIKIEISTDKEKEGIKTIFVLNDYNIVPRNTDNLTAYVISLTAFLKSDSMFFPSLSNAFSNAKSSDVLSELFTSQGYNIKNPTKTNDTMTWLQTNMSVFGMINHITDYAYKEDGTIIFAFVDKNFNAYIRDLITETKKPKTFDIVQSTDPIKLYYDQTSSLNDKKLTTLGYNFYRMGFHPGYNNQMGGYGTRGYVYDYDSPRNFKMKMNDDIHPMTDYSLKNKDEIKLQSFSDSDYFPMKYTGSNFHANYQKAYLQNKYLRRTFFSDLLVVNSYFNDEVKLLDKVNVDINSLAHSGSQSKEINKIYSGEYLVVGIISQINNGGNYKSILYLSRGGINQSALVDKTEMKLNAN